MDATFEGFRDTGGAASAAEGREPRSRPSAFDGPGPGSSSASCGRIGARRGRGRRSTSSTWPLPHWPWQYLPSGQQYPADTRRIPGRRGTGLGARPPSLLAQGYQRYLLQLGYVDRLIGRLIDAPARRRGSGTTRSSWWPPTTA